MTIDSTKIPILHSASPALAKSAPGVELVRLSLDVQHRLGCVVNEHVFLECPYAFVPRQALLELSQEAGSPFEPFSGKILAYGLSEVLVGYASARIEIDDSGDFIVCFAEDTLKDLTTQNRVITRNLRRAVEEEIRKQPRPWQDQGTADELVSTFLRPTRALQEIDLSLPVSELCRTRKLSNRSPDATRDGYVELAPLYEDFDNVELLTITQNCQTNLESKNEEAQTYPGHPKHQWTQYEFEATEEFVEVWKVEEEKEEEEENGKENSRDSDKSSLSKSGEEKELSAEELQLQKKRRAEWEKLNDFLKSYIDGMIDAVSFNASTNLYTNDVANLAADRTSLFSNSLKGYKEKESLIDLKTIGSRHLVSASWHYEVDDVILCTYLDENAKGNSLVAIWSLCRPLRPMMLLDCEEKVMTILFCPLKNYTDVIVGGCLDGKIVVWEVNRNSLATKDDKENDSSTMADQKDPLIKEAKIAALGEKSQELSITSVQWLPPWCRIESDGNFQKISSDTPKEQKAGFATASMDGTIFFWSLPRSLSTPAVVRSPLHLTISPVYQLIIEEPGDKTSKRIPITCFSFPLAKNEESSSLNLRDQSDLERLRKVFIGTNLGEVLCCTWESQTFAVDLSDREVCKIATRACIHDGIVKTMVKSPDLDDVFLTVGGRVFAVWKEDFALAPVYQRRSPDCKYGDGCWSGRSGMFVLTRFDGCFELWDLKRKPNEPVLLQTISEKIIPRIFPNNPTAPEKLLAILDGSATLRVYVEPDKSSKDEDLERVEWFEEFVWRETKRKLDFHRWQDDYLKQHPTALRRKAERDQAEANRRHQEARERFLKEQEKLAREEAERKLARRRVSKSVIWRQKEQKRAESILLQKKNFVPSELEEKRNPLVLLEQQRKERAKKTKKQLARAEEILNKCLTREIPEARFEKVKRGGKVNYEGDLKNVKKMCEEYEEDYKKIRDELLSKLEKQPYVPKFDWKETMDAGTRRMKSNAKLQDF